MISFIVCSINPHACEQLRQNISTTIGETDHEFLPFDNRQARQGICEVYNHQARLAQGENLCFLHEDVAFLSTDWGHVIEDKLNESDCGVIGFSGSQVKAKALSGVHCGREYQLHNYTDKLGQAFRTPPSPPAFIPTVTLDGLCLFVSRPHWATHPFDEHLLHGFHGYDLDFSLQQHQAGFHNQVCYAIQIRHSSNGSFNEAWSQAMVLLHKKKWDAWLPAYTFQPTQTEARNIESQALYEHTKTLLRGQTPLSSVKPLLLDYTRTYGLNHYARKLWIKVLYNRLLRIKR